MIALFGDPDWKNNLDKWRGKVESRTLSPGVTLPLQAGSAVAQTVKNRMLDREKKLREVMTGFKTDEERSGLITIFPLIIQSTKEAAEEQK